MIKTLCILPALFKYENEFQVQNYIDNDIIENFGFFGNIYFSNVGCY